MLEVVVFAQLIVVLYMLPSAKGIVKLITGSIYFDTLSKICTLQLLSDVMHDCHWQEWPTRLVLMVQLFSASITDTNFRLDELGVGLVDHHRDYRVSLTVKYSYSTHSYSLTFFSICICVILNRKVTMSILSSIKIFLAYDSWWDAVQLTI